jgi:DNA primase
VERFEGLDFLGALKMLAEKAGVPLQYHKSEDKGEKEKLHSLLEDATIFFEQELSKNSAAIDYLINRGVTKETISSFRLGFAPASWRALISHLEGKGYLPDLIEKAGLSKPGNRGNYDRFRGRIMFPISDTSGRVVAFSGRIFDKSIEGEGVEPAKYINSPETLLFHKSHILYGLNRAKEGIRKWTFAMVVEGQMDLIMSHQSGFNNAVALSGTALTPEQLKTLSRFTNNLLIALDADAAGISAAGKSATLALMEGFDVKVAHLKGGKDPADIIKEDVENWREIVRKSKHVVEFYLDLLESRELDKRKLRLEVVKIVLPFVAHIKSPVDRSHFLSVISERIGVPQNALIDELKSVSVIEKQGNVEATKIIEKNNVAFSRKDVILKNIIGMVKSGKAPISEDEIVAKLGYLTGDVEAIRAVFNDIAFGSEAAFALEMLSTQSPPKLEELLISFELQFLKEEQEKLQREIKISEREGEEESVKEKLQKYQTIAKQIQEKEEQVRKNHFSN